MSQSSTIQWPQLNSDQKQNDNDDYVELKDLCAMLDINDNNLDDPLVSGYIHEILPLSDPMICAHGIFKYNVKEVLNLLEKKKETKKVPPQKVPPQKLFIRQINVCTFLKENGLEEHSLPFWKNYESFPDPYVLHKGVILYKKDELLTFIQQVGSKKGKLIPQYEALRRCGVLSHDKYAYNYFLKNNNFPKPILRKAKHIYYDENEILDFIKNNKIQGATK